MSIAWAVLEHVSQQIRCKTLFSTHYHEITSLEGKLEGVKNYKIGVKEFNNSIIFLRKITRGSADKSFGIEVASIAGLPAEIIARAKDLLFIQESANTKATEVSFDGVKTAEKININTEELPQ
jgi:DNA mismatch repair protein MutS